MADLITGGRFRDIEIDGPRRMVLDPLAEVGIGVLMAVVIGGRQLVVHILRDGKRSQAKQDNEHRQ